jgi:hypothetical protein
MGLLVYVPIVALVIAGHSPRLEAKSAVLGWCIALFVGAVGLEFRHETRWVRSSVSDSSVHLRTDSLLCGGDFQRLAFSLSLGSMGGNFRSQGLQSPCPHAGNRVVFLGSFTF